MSLNTMSDTDSVAVEDKVTSRVVVSSTSTLSMDVPCAAVVMPLGLSSTSTVQDEQDHESKAGEFAATWMFTNTLSSGTRSMLFMAWSSTGGVSDCAPVAGTKTSIKRVVSNTARALREDQPMVLGRGGVFQIHPRLMFKPFKKPRR